MTFPHNKNLILEESLWELSKTLCPLFLKYFPFQSVLLVQLQNPVVQCIRAASCKSTLKMFPVAHVQNSFFQRQRWCHQQIALWVWLHRNPKYWRDCVHHAYQKQLSLCQILGFTVIIGPSWWGLECEDVNIQRNPRNIITCCSWRAEKRNALKRHVSLWCLTIFFQTKQSFCQVQYWLQILFHPCTARQTITFWNVLSIRGAGFHLICIHIFRS